MTFVLDAYAARSCPLKTVNSFTPHLVTPSLERPDPPFFRDSAAIEAAVFGALLAGPGRIEDLRPLRHAPRASAEQACLAALRPVDWSRSLVVHLDATVRVVNRTEVARPYVIADGQKDYQIEDGTEVEIRRSPVSALLVDLGLESPVARLRRGHQERAQT